MRLNSLTSNPNEIYVIPTFEYEEVVIPAVGDKDPNKRGPVALPARGTLESSGWDVFNNLNYAVRLGTLERVVIPLGYGLAIPSHLEVVVRPRSSWALKRGVTVVNTPGTIDSDYQQEIGVLLINLSPEVQVIEPGDKIAQLVPQYKVEGASFVPGSIRDFRETNRDGGFGSTGGGA